MKASCSLKAVMCSFRLKQSVVFVVHVLRMEPASTPACATLLGQNVLYTSNKTGQAVFAFCFRCRCELLVSIFLLQAAIWKVMAVQVSIMTQCFFDMYCVFATCFMRFVRCLSFRGET